MKKRFLAMVCAGVLAISMLSGCGGSSGDSSSKEETSDEGTESAENPEVEKWVIGYANRDDTDTYLKAVEDSFIELCDADDTIEVISADAEGDAQTQLDQLDNFNIQGVNCAVLVPQDGESVMDHIAAWNDEGVPVFCSSQAATGGEYIFVGASDYGMGMAQCEWAHDNLPENAKVLYLGGNMGYQTSIDRRQAVIDGLAERLHTGPDGEVLNENGDIEVLAWQECMYTQEEGMQITEDWIQTFDDFDAIIACNDRSALGALEALQGAGITDCMVIGLDGLQDALQAVKEGRMAATVLQSYEVQAQMLYDAVKEVQKGNEVDPVINPEVITIDSANVDEYLE